MKTINKVYTRTGDSGMTSLVGGARIKKTDVRLEAYGTVDELSAQLGLLAAMLPDGDDRTEIIRIQNNLFDVCSHLATDVSRTPQVKAAQLGEGEIERLEALVDDVMAQLPERQGFVLPGGCKEAAQAHVARTVCRRAERRIAALAEEAEVAPEILQYVNRLSDFLFVLAKKINFVAGKAEIIWQKTCK